MLERFHVPEEIAVRVPQEKMRATVEDIFRKMGMPDDDAVQSADVLLYADIRGIESHGVSNMMRAYVEGFGRGSINPTPNWRIVKDNPAACTIDADKGHGLVVCPAAMRIAIEKAEKYGIGSAAVMNCGHSGPLAYHAAMAIKQDMIGMAMTAGGLNVAPTWGAEPLVGLNPMGIAAPTRNEPPFIFDAAFSSVAGNKLRLAQRLGVNMMPGWVAGLDGDPIMDERPLPDEYVVLPVGGTREIGSHKGYSVLLMIEILTSILAGGGGGPMRDKGSSHHLIAYNIGAYSNVDDFKDHMDEYLRALRKSKPAPGHDRVYYAGLPEHEEEIERRAHGIPYHPEVMEWFDSITAELGMPAVMDR